MNNPDQLTALLTGDATDGDESWQGLMQEHWGDMIPDLLRMKDDVAITSQLFDEYILRALKQKIVPYLEGHHEYDAAYTVQNLYQRKLNYEDLSVAAWKKPRKKLNEMVEFYLKNGNIEIGYRLKALKWATHQDDPEMAPSFALYLARIDDRLHPQARAVMMAWMCSTLLNAMNGAIMSYHH